MYYCENCETLFEFPTTITEGHYGYMRAMCPECHSEDIEVAEKCKVCGESYPDFKVDDGLCDNCRKTLAEDWWFFANRYAADYHLGISEFCGLITDFIQEAGV